MNRMHSCRFILVIFFSYVQFSVNISLAAAFDHPNDGTSQNRTDSVIVHQIRIHGNTITRKGIILREMRVKEHDTLSLMQFSDRIAGSKQNIFNTRLFNFVTIDTTFITGTRMVDVGISVIERWYIWPIPFVEISDRNFNVWWETRDFSRLTYGVDFTFFNARGRNETFRILTHFGFNKKFGFIYKIPYINKNQTLGMGFGAAIELNHELPVFTRDNEPVYIRKNSTYLKKLVHVYAEANLRPDYFSTHIFRLAYSHYHFDSLIRNLPGFVISQQDNQQFFTITYLYKNDHRDVQFYPLKGYCLDVELNHAIPYETAHNSYLRTNLRIYFQILSRWYWASGFTGKISFAKIQPYYLQRGLGYERDFARGYEYTVADGQHFALLKNDLKFALVPQRVEKIEYIRTTKFNTIPLSLYLNAFLDIGYAYHYHAYDSGTFSVGNTLENCFLIGYGLGIDFTTYYDVVIRVEGAMNRMNQPGIYFHFIAPI